MKFSDIVKLQEAGFITPEQRQRIIDHFGLKEEGTKFLAIIAMIGAVLVTSGIILLISAHWDAIPRGVKIAGGLVLMLGAHAGGYYLREVRREYLKSGEALHFIGAGMFLANIGLIGQIYHLSARPPNAILLWWVGIAALPWLLRALSLHILSLLSFLLWFGLEINQADSWFFFNGGICQLCLYALVGLIFLGGGYVLRDSKFDEFAPTTEQLGLLVYQACSFPLTWEVFYNADLHKSPKAIGAFVVLSVVALGLLALGLRKARALTPQWRLTWFGALAAGVALLAAAIWLSPSLTFEPDRFQHHTAFHWIATIVLFVIGLLQIQVGVQMRSSSVVNIGVAAIALNIIATYINLIGSMAQTGLMFVMSGVFLIALGVFLEKKRRRFIQQIRTA